MPIPTEKIVAVTGDPRSGTSLVMQTLDRLGVPVAGLAYPMEQRLLKDQDNLTPERKAELEKQVADAKTLNPKGFYELPRVVMRGFTEIKPAWNRKAVKIIAPGMTRTPVEFVYRGIICLRDPRHVAQSQTRLKRNVETAGARGWDRPSLRVSPVRYLREMAQFSEWLLGLERSERSKFMAVDYDTFVDDPESTVDAIIAHLRLTPTTAERQAAIDNVDGNLRRSPDDFTAWPTREASAGAAVELIYAALKDRSGLTAALSAARTTAHQLRKAANKVYMQEINLNVTDEIRQQVLADAAYRELLRADFVRDCHKGLNPRVDRSFQISDKDYVVELPSGDLPRKKVRYAGRLMTWEECFVLHQRRWFNIEVRIDQAKLAAVIGETS